MDAKPLGKDRGEDETAAAEHRGAGAGLTPWGKHRTESCRSPDFILCRHTHTFPEGT